MNPYLLNMLLVFILMLITWGISVRLRDVSIIDPVWGLGFVIISAASMLNALRLGTPCFSLASLLLGLLTIVWGLRLGGYLAWRKIKEPEEDYRYREMREKRGDSFWWLSFFTIFLLQGVIMFLISLPIQLGVFSEACFGESQKDWILLILGIAIWSVGLFFETIGDWQLARFKADKSNRSEVLDTGLWRYTRHPNYFGDFCVWWGLWFISIAAGGPWWTIYSPAVMSLLLMKVSGVTLTEKAISNRRPGYADYQMRTNAFFPWPPK